MVARDRAPPPSRAARLRSRAHAACLSPLPPDIRREYLQGCKLRSLILGIGRVA
jgi:hypothetical protein